MKRVCNCLVNVVINVQANTLFITIGNEKDNSRIIYQKLPYIPSLSKHIKRILCNYKYIIEFLNIRNTV